MFIKRDRPLSVDSWKSIIKSALPEYNLMELSKTMFANFIIFIERKEGMVDAISQTQRLDKRILLEITTISDTEYQTCYLYYTISPEVKAVFFTKVIERQEGLAPEWFTDI